MTHPNFSFRQATESDLEFLYTLMKTTMRDHIITTWGAWDEQFQREYFQKKCQPESNQIIVINNEDVGAIMTSEDDNNITIDRFFLLPPYQGQGIGTAVESQIIKEAREKGKSLSLTVIKTNGRARKFHERLGLRVIDENDERFFMRID